MGRDPRTRRGKRVTEGDCAAVSVELLARNSELPLDGARLRSKGLVHLDQVNVVEAHSCRCQSAPRSRYRPYAHDSRINSGESPGNESTERRKAAVTREFLARDHHRPGAVADSRCVPRSDHPVLDEYRLEATKSLHRAVGPHVLITIERLDLASSGILHRNAYDFVCKDSIRP